MHLGLGQRRSDVKNRRNIRTVHLNEKKKKKEKNNKIVILYQRSSRVYSSFFFGHFYTI